MVSTSVTVKAGHYCIPPLAVEVIIRAGNAKEHLIRYGIVISNGLESIA